MKKINLIVTGGIGASKSYELYLLLKKKYDVSVMLSKNAKYFVDFKDTPIHSDIFQKDFYDPHSTGEHIAKTYESDFNIVYPATYNFIGKIASGICDDLPSLIFAASSSHSWLFPSMNSRMYLNPIFERNKDLLKADNKIHWIEPKTGRLASGEIGIGRSLEPKEAFEIIESYNNKYLKLRNKKVLINFGRTRTYLDKIRYLTNESSGQMGLEILNVLKEFSVPTQAIVGDCDFDIKSISNLKRVKTNQEMLEAMVDNFSQSQIVICAAALNDFEFSNYYDKKLDKRSIDIQNYKIDLKESVDVLRELGKIKTNQILVGFSLANDFDLQKSWIKMAEKNLDILILNLTSAMSNNQTEIKILISKSKKVINFLPKSKAETSLDILNIIEDYI
ncbi:bifunctional phosphopantothenoylcysteine decarboxylase/phosphopantothenate--cysteine ligase CoaBC [Spiroplasma endosymbiont of Panorpa germanica]|uniref:bifunctional phosphopantothenoylcysteine decarboxylase/phosphopantothenate--cysteine ligase CoaBC n=1 Tax=Spiroplasma endosymbiont of Panorpa germanica TaxID=3066314 RepID=UPI0030CD982B